MYQMITLVLELRVAEQRGGEEGISDRHGIHWLVEVEGCIEEVGWGKRKGEERQGEEVSDDHAPWESTDCV